MHTLHEDTHTHGFNDSCERCQRYVNELYGIDAVNLKRIWTGDIKTRTDMDVYNALYSAAVITQKLESAFSIPTHEVNIFHVGGHV